MKKFSAKKFEISHVAYFWGISLYCFKFQGLWRRVFHRRWRVIIWGVFQIKHEDDISFELSDIKWFFIYRSHRFFNTFNCKQFVLTVGWVGEKGFQTVISISFPYKISHVYKFVSFRKWYMKNVAISQPMNYLANLYIFYFHWLLKNI